MAIPSPDQHDPFNTKRPEVHRIKGWRSCILYPVAWLLRLCFLTWRIRLDPQSRQLFDATGRPRLVVVWHNRSLVMPEVFRRIFDPSTVACLVSPSKMAAWEVAFFEMFRLRIVRGSTTRRSIQAAMEMFRELKLGHDVGISPDGPSGPLYGFQPGAIAMAKKAGVPMLVVIPNARSAYRTRTWDRHLVPFPFARINVRMKVFLPDDPVFQGSNEQVAAKIRRVCLEITEDPFKAPSYEQA